MSGKISVSKVAQKITDANRTNAQMRAEKKLDDIVSKLSALGCDVRSVPCSDPFKYYGQLGYYRFAAEEEYETFTATGTGSITDKDEYSISMEYKTQDGKKKYNASIYDNGVSHKFTYSYTKVKAERWFKAIKPGELDFVKSKEAMLCGEGDGNTYFDVKTGGAVAKPQKFPFVVANVLGILASIFMLLFYVLSTARFDGLTSPYIWDGILLNNIPGFFAFAKANQVLMYASMGVAVVFALGQWLIHKLYINKFINAKHNKSSVNLITTIVLVIVMLVNFGLGYLTYDTTDGVLPKIVGVVIAQFLGTVLFILENIARIASMLVLLGMGVGLGIVNAIRGVEYKSALEKCNKRIEFMEGDGAKMTAYDQILADVLDKTYIISPLIDGEVVTSEYFDENSKNFVFVERN